MRIVRLDVCGNPVTGAGSVIVTDGFVQINPSPEYEEGEEFLTKKASGAPCVNQKDPNFLKRVGLSIDFCEIDPDAIVLMTGERLLGTGAPVTGSGVAFGEGLLTARFSLEVWQEVAGAGACSAAGLQQFVYWAFPNVGNTMVGDYTIENGTSTFSIEADTMAAGPQWGNGPGSGTSWLPSGVTLDTTEHFAFNVTTVPLPAVACGATALT